MAEGDFEARVNRNLADNKAMAARLLSEFKAFAGQPPLSSTSVRRARKPRMKVIDPALLEPRRNPSRRAKKPNDEDRSGFYSPGNTVHEKENNSGSGKKFLVKLQGHLRTRLRLGADASANDENNNEEECEDDEVKVYDDDDDWMALDDGDKIRRRKSAQIVRSDEISEIELKLVATCTSEKVYDKINGTSCHQCRQKTRDTKTVCRSGICVGIRGMFCGPCLKNRYGEDATEALMNKEWACPPCREMCNCSICRRRGGKSCTGILVHTARQKGFPDVSSYLSHLSASSSSASSSSASSSASS